MDDADVDRGSMLLAADGTIVECNAQLARMAGRSVEDLIGRPLIHVLVTDPVDAFTVGGPFGSLPAWLEQPDGKRVAVAVRPFPFGLVGQDEATWIVVARTWSGRVGARSGITQRRRTSAEA